MTAPGYRHILLATDLEPRDELPARRALALARATGARLSLIHVVEYVPAELPSELLELPQLEMEDELLRAARERLEVFNQQAGLQAGTLYVEIGSTKYEILRIAEEEGVDLIVVGSPRHHGLAALLGSTAKAVLQGAPCDVLAVHIPRDQTRTDTHRPSNG